MNNLQFVDFSHVPITVETKNSVYTNSITHYHDTIEFTIFEHCHCHVFCQDNWYEVRDGSLLWLPRYSIHRVDYLENNLYTRIQVNLKQEWLLPALKAMGGQSLLDKAIMEKCHHLTPKPAAFKELLHMFSYAQKLYNAYIDSPSSLNSCLLQSHTILLLSEIFSHVDGDTKDILPRAPTNLYVKKTIEYIDANYSYPLSLDSLAEQMHIDKYYMCHIFKQHVGLTIIKYIQYRRIIEAQKMILYSDKPLDVISSSCGFNCIQHFYKVFKEVTGYSPGQYVAK